MTGLNRQYKWVTKNGTKIALKDLTDKHLESIIRCIENFSIKVSLKEYSQVKWEYELREKQSKINRNDILKDLCSK